MHRPKTLATSLLAIVALLAACVTADLPEGSAPEHVYYAAAADYIQAKRAAAKYAAEPSTPRAHVQEILKVVDEIDPRLSAFERIRRGQCDHPVAVAHLPELAQLCSLRSGDYMTAAGQLRLASATLRRFAVKEEAR